MTVVAGAPPMFADWAELPDSRRKGFAGRPAAALGGSSSGRLKSSRASPPSSACRYGRDTD